VEPVIGHVKTDGLLARNGLKGEAGAALHAVMRGAGRALRLVLARSPWRARGAGALLAP
jgi:IS5 family transposase